MNVLNLRDDDILRDAWGIGWLHGLRNCMKAFYLVSKQKADRPDRVAQVVLRLSDKLLVVESLKRP